MHDASLDPEHPLKVTAYKCMVEINFNFEMLFIKFFKLKRYTLETLSSKRKKIEL